MTIMKEYIKFRKYKMDLKMAAVYVADVLNNDVPMGEKEEVIKDFLKDLAELTRREIAITEMK